MLIWEKTKTAIELLIDTREIADVSSFSFCRTDEQKVQESVERFQLSFYRSRKNTNFTKARSY